MKKQLDSKAQGVRLKRGGVSVLYTIVFLALIIALNLVVSAVAGSINLNIDLTAEDFISIGEVSRRVLDSLQADGDLEATIYLLADRDAYNSGDSTNGLTLPTLVRDLCEEYAYSYDGIRVEYKNLERDPEWGAKYNEITNTKLTKQNIVVEGKYHARVLTLMSFFTIDSESGAYVGFNGELRLTTALLQSCISEPQVVTFTTGHGEPLQVKDGAVQTALASTLRNAGFELLTADLSSQEIDPRTKIVMVVDPLTDFTEIEVEKLMDYTDGYNSLMVFVDDSTPELPNLSDYLLEEWGLGYRAYHQISSSDNFRNDVLNLSARYNDSAENPNTSAAYQMIKNLASADLRTIMPHSVELYSSTNSTKDKYTLETVLLSSEKSASTYVLNGEQQKTEGAFPLVMLSSNADYVNLDDENSTNQVLKYQYVMLLGSTDFVGDGVIDSAAYSNNTLLLSTVRTMGMERYSLDIDYKSIRDVALSIETSTAARLGIVICVVLPALIVVAGLTVFVRRRHL